MIVHSNCRVSLPVVIFHIFFLCFGRFCLAQPTHIVMRAGQQSQIEKMNLGPFRLADITYESDSCIEPHEFFYLVGLKKKSVVSSDQITKAVTYLFKKQKFEKIELVLSDNGAGKNLHFKLTSFWTCGRLKIRGVPVGRYRYRQCYLMEPGDRFDKDKHMRSLERIEQSLKDEGYFQGKIFCSLDRDTYTKSVLTAITINRGRKFSIGFVQATFKGRDCSGYTGCSGLLGQMGDALAQQLSGHSYLKTSINKEIEEFKRKLAKRGFLHIDIRLREKIDRSRKKVDLHFSIDVLERRTFVFFGNSFFTDTQLLDQILQFGASAWLVPASMLASELEHEYKNKGFWSIKVEAQEERCRIFFVVKEGVRSSVKKISIKGSKAFEQRALIKSCFTPLVRKKQFDQDILNRCLQKLETLYSKHGFWNMRVLKQSFAPIDDGPTQRLDLVIDEGVRTVLVSVSIPRFPDLVARHPFRAYCGKHVHVPFDPQIVQEQKLWLEAYCKEKGYAHAQIKHELVRDGDTVQLVWNVDTGPTKRFGKTVLLGSSRFPFNTILTQLDYKEGQVWNKKSLKETSARFRALNLFERVHLYPDNQLSIDSTQDVFLKLHKDDPFEMRFRAGVGLQQVGRNFSFERGALYKVGGTFLVKNPFNIGDRFIVDTDFARSYRNVNVEYVRACLFGVPLINRFKLYANRYEQPGFVCSKKDLYEISQEGFLVGAKGRYGLFDISGTVGVEWMRTRVKKEMQAVADQIANAICFQSSLLDKRIPYFFIEPVLLIDYLDDKLNPKCGFFTLLTCKGMVPLSDKYVDAYFFKFLAKQSFFIPVGPTVAALHIRFGHIFHQKFKQIMPFERFYLGGAHSVRSYETDLCPPLGSFQDESEVKSCVPQGGKTMVNGNVELRFPIISDMGGVIFQDVGVLIGSVCSGFNPSNVVAATGFGLRYNTPIGPLRFDIGWKWRACCPSEHSYAWFLSLGHAF